MQTIRVKIVIITGRDCGSMDPKISFTFPLVHSFTGLIPKIPVRETEIDAAGTNLPVLFDLQIFCNFIYTELS